MRVQSLGQEDPLEEEMATHSSILDWRFSWTEEPGGLHSKGTHQSHILENLPNCHFRDASREGGRTSTSLVAQTVKRLPTMWEPRFDPWVGKILWRREWQPSTLAWKIP